MLRERRRAANFKPNRRLDRKSSRGMIYENEELRLRTININAEVERGQSDIRKLRRENEQLRREIWSLRDEYDRLDQLLRRNKNKDGAHSAGDSGSSTKHAHRRHHNEDRDCCEEDEEGEEEEEEEDEDCCSCNRSDEDPDGEHRCDDCDSGEEYCDDENCNCGAEGRCISGGGGAVSTCNKMDKHPSAPPMELTAAAAAAGVTSSKNLNGSSTGSSSSTSAKLREHLHVNFDHLSIVSEENMTGSDGSSSVHNLPTDTATAAAAAPPNSLTVPSLGPVPDGKDYSATTTAAACPPQTSSSSSPMLIMSLPTTPCSPHLSDFQSIVPPLSHFETINYDDIKPLPTTTTATKSSSTSSAPSSALVAASANLISKAASSPICSAKSFASSPTAPLDIPSIAPSPEPPDSCPSELPILVASSVSSSDWSWNNKTVSFSTFRPPGAAPHVPSSSIISATTSFPSILKCDRPAEGGGSRAGPVGRSREEGEIVVINPTPRHFFSPLKSSRSMQLPTSPDLYVHDVLASPAGSSNSINAIHEAAAGAIVAEPIYSTVHKSRPSHNPLSISTTCFPITAVENPLYGGCCSSSPYPYPIAGPATLMATTAAAPPYGFKPSVSRSPTTAFQVGGNLEELLQDIESMTDDVTQLDLSYEDDVHEGDGVHLRVVPAGEPVSLSDLTPPPKLPEPMSLLPATLPYLDFKSNTAVITTPKAALANRENGTAVPSGGTQTTVTAVVSKPISSAQAVRRKLFGKKNKEPVIGAPDHDRVVPLKITIPSASEVASGSSRVVAADDKVIGQSSTKNSTTAPVGIDEGGGEAVGGQKRKSRRVSLSFPSFGGGSSKKAPEDEKDTSSLENLPSATGISNQAGHGKSSSGKQPLHRVSSGADISSISTSMGSPSTPVKGPCHHHRHNSQKRGKGRQGHHSRTSSESHNVYSSPNHGHHHNGDGRRNSTMNDAMTTSMSERNSNSLASSRESSTSLSMRSQKSRRISENSHSGGKIPWCGCWGNGCL